MPIERDNLVPALRVALIVPVRNGGSVWQRVAASILRQSRQPDHVLVIDSASSDGSAGVAREHGFEVLSIPVESFDHGGTRQLAARRCQDFDVLVYLTQDAELADTDALAALLRAFDDQQVAVAYGRQLPRRGALPIEAHARLFNYPACGQRRCLAHRQELGLKVAFTSDSFCAYRTVDLFAVGGFPERIIVSEDMVVAARLLQAARVVAYVAEACVYHSHAYSLTQEFRRYFDIGVLHRQQEWLLHQFGRPEGEGLRFVRSELRYLACHAPWLIPSALCRTFGKWLGYQLGRQYRRLPPIWLRRLSMHQGYWQHA